MDYLNSLHNDMASNQNAIAELAIASPYFDATQVKRGLVEFVKKKIESNTGHPVALEHFIEFYNNLSSEQKAKIEYIIIDATLKKSASKA